MIEFNWIVFHVVEIHHKFLSIKLPSDATDYYLENIKDIPKIPYSLFYIFEKNICFFYVNIVIAFG